MPYYQVIFFQKENGSYPAEDFINSLGDKMSAKLYRLISIVREEGPELREPYSKPLGSGIFELRAQFGSDISRVLYFFVVGRRVVLTNGFIKKTQKTQKTPKTEIDTARAYRKEYLEREGHYEDI